MTSTMMAFGIAAGGAALVCFLLMARWQNRRPVNGSPADSSGSNSGQYAGGDGWSIPNWFGGDNSGSHDSGASSDGGGGASGGGGDGGGGGSGGD